MHFNSCNSMLPCWYIFLVVLWRLITQKLLQRWFWMKNMDFTLGERWISLLGGKKWIQSIRCWNMLSHIIVKHLMKDTSLCGHFLKKGHKKLGIGDTASIKWMMQTVFFNHLPHGGNVPSVAIHFPVATCIMFLS